jgi:hypothetical protein
VQTNGRQINVYDSSTIRCFEPMSTNMSTIRLFLVLIQRQLIVDTFLCRAFGSLIKITLPPIRAVPVYDSSNGPRANG